MFVKYTVLETTKTSRKMEINQSKTIQRKQENKVIWDKNPKNIHKEQEKDKQTSREID
jgi:hypothetical protein